jgi:hypothetical protein
LIKLLFLYFENSIPAFLNNYNTTVKQTHIRFVPLIYLSHIIVLILNII